MRLQKILVAFAFVVATCKDQEVLSQRQFTSSEAAPRFMAIVTSKDGLILREKPQRSSQKLELIEFAQSVEIQPQKKPISETIDGISGEWLETHYSGSNGFIFSAYVRRFAEIAASVESLDEGRLYGVWQNQKFVDYTKKPVTQLNLKPNRQFQFTIFAGGDGGGFGTKSLENFDAEYPGGLSRQRSQ